MPHRPSEPEDLVLKNYLTIAYRTLLRRKGYAAINVLGLAVGVACCLLIGLYVRYELSYDDFHAEADRLYRLTYEHRLGEDLPPAAPEEYRAWGSAAVAPLLEADFAAVERAVRLSGRHQILLARGERAFQEERYFFADPDVFEVFSFPLLRGDPRTALDGPGRIVLTEEAAARYFGDEDPMGQTLRINSAEAEAELVVTGILAAIPANTHIAFDLLVSMRTFENTVRAADQDYKFDSWGYVDFFTYVLLREGADASALQAALPAFVERHNGDDFQDPPQSYTLDLEPITEAYLSPVGGFATGPRGNEASLYLFAFVGLFILLIACINFVNLATARATGRAKEVGVRKTVGAARSTLVAQFLAETLLLTTLATSLAVALSWAALPVFQTLAGKDVPVDALLGAPMLGVLVVGTLVVGLLAGSYPAFTLSGFRAAEVLRGSFATSARGAGLRRGLVAFQFVAAIVLVIGTLVVHDQLQYLQSRPLGFDDAQQLVLDFGHDDDVRRNVETIKEEFEALPQVQQAAATRSVPGRYFPQADTRVETPDGTMQTVVPGLYEVDVDFLSQLGVGVAAGRLFERSFETDAEEALILNEAAAHELGYADPADAVGKRFEQWGRAGTVVGVVQNFNHESLRHEIRPLTFRVSPWLRYLVLQVSAEDAARVVPAVRARWEELVPNRPFLFSFLDASFDTQYRAEERFGTLFGTFAGLAIFVACLGLFGLAAYMAQQRRKEIGVRKVLGASVANVTALLSRDFLVLVGVAFGVAAPIAYLLAQRWLEGFAYQVDLAPWTFGAAGILALVVALCTVAFQAVRAALADPVESLRSE